MDYANIKYKYKDHCVVRKGKYLKYDTDNPGGEELTEEDKNMMIISDSVIDIVTSPFFSNNQNNKLRFESEYGFTCRYLIDHIIPDYLTEIVNIPGSEDWGMDNAFYLNWLKYTSTSDDGIPCYHLGLDC